MWIIHIKLKYFDEKKYKNNRCDYVHKQANLHECLITYQSEKSTSELELLVFFTIINFVLKRA